MPMTLYQQLAQAQQEGRSCALCTVIGAQGSTPRHHTAKMLVFSDGTFSGTIGGGEMESLVLKEAKQALEDGKARRLTYHLNDPKKGDPGVCGGTMEIFVEAILPKPTLIVVGAGHVGRALTNLAHWLDFHVIVSDDREEFCNAQQTPHGDQYVVCPLSQLPSHVDIHDGCYVVLTTRNIQVDVEGLPALLQCKSAYLGVIGSARRWTTTRNKLQETGLSDDALSQVVSPIGLDIGAESPEEIAVSIMAEIMQRRRNTSGAPLSPSP